MSKIIFAIVSIFMASSGLAQTRILEMRTDQENICYKVGYSGAHLYRQVLLDTDQKKSTGYNFNGVIGADFLIENNSLYRYAGTNGSWGWTLVTKNINYAVSAIAENSYLASWNFPKSIVGFPVNIDLVANTHSPAVASQKMTQTVQSEVVFARIQEDTKYFYYQLAFTGLPQNHYIYFDTDQNPKTGWSINGIGADYMVENDRLLRYSSESKSWNTVPGVDVGYFNASNMATWKIPSLSLGAPVQIDFFGHVQFPQGITSTVSQRNPLKQPFSEKASGIVL